MKKRTLKTIGLFLVVAVSAMMLLTSCGGKATLEDYINSNEEAKASIESANTESTEGGMGTTVRVEDNTLIYEFTYSETYEAESLETMAEYFEEYMESASSTFTSIATQLEEESEIDGITVRVTYLNGDGTEIYSKEYE